MNTRGKKIAGWAAGLGILILIGTGLAGRRTVWEYWCVYRLESPDEIERRAVAEKLLEFKSARAAPRILETFADADDFEEWIRRVVETLGPKARTAAPTLVDTLEGRRDRKVRVAAARALRRLGPDAEEALPGLIRALRDKDVEIRSCAAETLERIGSGASLAVPDLIDALNDRSWQVRDLAAMALSATGSAAVEPLVEALAETDAQDPLVVWTLGEIGRDALGAAHLLEKILHGGHAGLRRRAATALGKIGAPAPTGVTALQRATKDPDNHVRLAALEALRRIESERGQRRAEAR